MVKTRHAEKKVHKAQKSQLYSDIIMVFRGCNLQGLFLEVIKKGNKRLKNFPRFDGFFPFLTV